MQQASEFENMVYEEKLRVINPCFSVYKEKHVRRFNAKSHSAKQCKLSPVNRKGEELWDKYTSYKEQMFRQTHLEKNPWIITKTNLNGKARITAIRHLLKHIPHNN
jgi:polyphosphate kinase 2 (PPK2 family)